MFVSFTFYPNSRRRPITLPCNLLPVSLSVTFNTVSDVIIPWKWSFKLDHRTLSRQCWPDRNKTILKKAFLALQFRQSSCGNRVNSFRTSKSWPSRAGDGRDFEFSSTQTRQVGSAQARVHKNMYSWYRQCL